MDLKKLVIEQMEMSLNKIKQNTCEIDKETAMQILSIVAHEPLSKAQSFQELHMSRSKFDSLVNKGVLPPGRKRIGFNELAWYRDELLIHCEEIKNGK